MEKKYLYDAREQCIFTDDGKSQQALFGSIPLCYISNNTINNCISVAHECLVSADVLFTLGFTINEDIFELGNIKIKWDIKDPIFSCNGQEIKLFSDLVALLDAHGINVKYSKALIDSFPR